MEETRVGWQRRRRLYILQECRQPSRENKEEANTSFGWETNEQPGCCCLFSDSPVNRKSLGSDATTKLCSRTLWVFVCRPSGVAACDFTSGRLRESVSHLRPDRFLFLDVTWAPADDVVLPIKLFFSFHLHWSSGSAQSPISSTELSPLLQWPERLPKDSSLARYRLFPHSVFVSSHRLFCMNI